MRGKDRLAGVYESFARRLLHPADPAANPDPEGAYALLAQARELAKGDATRGGLLLTMAEASQKAGNHARAIQNFQLYLANNPNSRRGSIPNPLAEPCRGRLGGDDPGVLRPGRIATRRRHDRAARLTWNDLASDMVVLDTPLAADYRAKCLFGIAATYGIPAPPDDNAMNLGIGSLRRLIRGYPGNQLATKAA